MVDIKLFVDEENDGLGELRNCYIRSNEQDIKIPDVTTVSWGYLAGSRAQQADIILPSILAENMLGEIELCMNDITYQQLYIINKSYISEGFTRVTIADKRHFWVFKSLTKKAYIFNKTRFAAIKQNFNNFNNASVAGFRYNSQTINPTTLEPWTSFEILLYLLTEELSETPEIRGYQDNKNTKDNLSFLGSSFPAVLESLCEDAGCLMFLSQEGTLVISDAQKIDTQQTFEKSKISGKIEWNGELVKPSKIKVTFIKEKEIEFSNDLTGSYLVGNVIPMPFNSDDFGQIDGEDYLAGSFLPFTSVLKKIGILEPDWRKRMPSNNGIYVALGLTKGLLKEYVGNISKKERKLIQLANLLFSSYRSIWRISDYWLDRLLNLKPFMVAVVDEFTKTRRPSEVRCDWCAKHAFFDPAEKNAQVLVNFRKSDDEVAPVNASVNEQMGIISLSFGSDVFGMYSSRHFGQFISEGFVKDFLSVYDARMKKPELDYRFNFSVIISANEINDYVYSIEKDMVYNSRGEGFQNAKKEPLTLEIFIDRVKAEYDKTGKLINSDVLELVAQLQADLYSFSWQDKPVGEKTIQYDSTLQNLEGSLVRIAHELGGGVDKTKFIAQHRNTPLPDLTRFPASFKQLYFNILGG